MANEPRGVDPKAWDRVTAGIKSVEANRRPVGRLGRDRPAGSAARCRGGSVFKLYVIGGPTDGSFDLDIVVDGNSETITVEWDDTPATLRPKIESHADIDDDEIEIEANADAIIANNSFTIRSAGGLRTKDFDIVLTFGFVNELTGGIGQPYPFVDECFCR
jgi:hypothetical protein